MPMTKDQILAAAMALDPRERERLADELLRTLSDDDCRAIDEAWLKEVRDRDAALAAGEITASPVDEVIARVPSRARS